MREVLLLLGCALLVATALTARVTYRGTAVLRRAERTRGVVTDLEYPAPRQVLPVVQYTTVDGRTVVARPHAAAASARLAVGQSVALRYDPADPQLVVLEGAAGSGAGYGPVAALGTAAVVALLAWWLI